MDKHETILSRKYLLLKQTSQYKIFSYVDKRNKQNSVCNIIPTERIFVSINTNYKLKSMTLYQKRKCIIDSQTLAITEIQWILIFNSKVRLIDLGIYSFAEYGIDCIIRVFFRWHVSSKVINVFLRNWVQPTKYNLLGEYLLKQEIGAILNLSIMSHKCSMG